MAKSRYANVSVSRRRRCAFRRAHRHPLIFFCICATKGCDVGHIMVTPAICPNSCRTRPLGDTHLGGQRGYLLTDGACPMIVSPAGGSVNRKMNAHQPELHIASGLRRRGWPFTPGRPCALRMSGTSICRSKCVCMRSRTRVRRYAVATPYSVQPRVWPSRCCKMLRLSAVAVLRAHRGLRPSYCATAAASIGHPMGIFTYSERQHTDFAASILYYVIRSCATAAAVTKLATGR